jgi:zinc/manganese transport system substrate-binding protein
MIISKAKWLFYLAAVALVVFFLSGGAQMADGPKIKVVAAERFWGEVAQAVGGDQVEVVSLIANPAEDPHDYEPTANDARLVTDAQVVVYTGIGYDDWMARFLQASSGTDKQVVAVAHDLLGKEDGDNPHVWYIPSSMQILAHKLADDFSAVDPDHAQDYQARADGYCASLAPLLDKVSALRRLNQVSIDVSEPVFNYMADALNLQVKNPKFAQAVEDGNDPSAMDIATVENDIRSKQIAFFVYNTQTDMPTVANLAKLAQENGIPVVQVTETQPAGKNYLQWMSDELDQVAQVLANQ